MSKSKYQESLKKNKIYFERLADMDSTGELAKYNTRSAVARAVGFTDRRKGYTWVCNAINRGRIKETVLEVVNGKKYYEYHYGRDAIARGENLRKAAAIKRIKKEMERRGMTPVDQQVTTTAKLSIKYGKVEVNITEDVPVEYVVALVKQLNKE